MFLKAAFVLAFLSLSSSFEFKAQLEVRVKTKFGEITGVEQKTSDRSKYYVFYSVPYAKPPIRFKDSEPWTDQFPDGVRESQKPTRCVQYLAHLKDLVILGEEDCLYLNIYTPTLDATAKYDVIVFIHGGGFIYGAGYSQTPEYLFLYNKELVFVSINYRLGPFGFLTTDDEVVPGNMGLKDQVIALEWVRDNIHNFGGDPSKVTIAGMSAGAISVQLHYLAPMSQDLFSRGISMSGVALSNLVKTKDVRKDAEHLAGLMNCPSEKSEEMINCLRTKPAREIIKRMVEDNIPWRVFNAYYAFGPVIDKYSPNPFLIEHPYFTLRSGNMKHAPWLASATTAEGLKPAGLFIDNEERVAELNQYWEEIAPYLLAFKHVAPENMMKEISHEIIQHYLQGHPIAKHSRSQTIKLIGDRLYMNGIENSVRLHAKGSNAPVYFYMFGYRGIQSFSSLFSRTDTDLGASHIDDMIYILKMNGFDPMKRNEAMVKRMVGVWTSFMKEDAPVVSPNQEHPWPRVARNIAVKGALRYPVISDVSRVAFASTMDLSDREFWERLPLKELHIAGDRRMPLYIRDLQKKPPSRVRRYILKSIGKLKYKMLRVLGKIKEKIEAERFIG